MLANWYGQPGLAAEYDARSGAERSWVRMPAKHGFPDHGYVDDASVAVIDTSECERGVTRLWGFKERAIVAEVHKPERCDRDKEKFEPEAVRIFQGAQPPRMLVVQGDAPDLLVWDMTARKLDKTILWPGQASPANVIGVSPDLKSVAVVEPGMVRIRAVRRRYHEQGICVASGPQSATAWRLAPTCKLCFSAPFERAKSQSST